MDKFVLYVVVLLAASASVKSQYNQCRKNLEFCIYDSECCTNYCEYELGEDGTSGFCTEWPFPNCGRDGDDCLHGTDCCHGFCAHEENKYATFNYCTNGPIPSFSPPPIAFAPLPASPSLAPEFFSDDSYGFAPVPVASPEASDLSPPSPLAPEISPSFGIAPSPSPLADDSTGPEFPLSPEESTTPTTTPPPTPCHEKTKKHKSRKWKHAKAPKAPSPGRGF